MRFALPLAALLALALLLGLGLRRDPHVLPSALVGRAAPAITLPLLHEPGQKLQVDALRGQVWLLNVWASWCGPCAEELPVLSELATRDAVAVYGLNLKDDRAAALRLLQRRGNPYVATAFDADGRVAMDYGVAGVPETFVVDREGRILHRHLGSVTPEVWRAQLLPVVRSLR